ncbi:MAG: hydrogenase expression/formation protein HypE [Candidatus Omnitrophica bacterium]|nr:hydrogenase expression/formation protein HypE [Candidatus Omnitrophota bacterium]
MTDKILNNTCPIPIQKYPRVMMAHGGGGRLMKNLIEQMFQTAFPKPSIDYQHDAAVFFCHSQRLAVTTDSFVVHPLIFPGGDIGSLAVHGTVNDLAMAGAKPLYLTVGFIIEEGLEMQTLWQIVQSMAKAVKSIGIDIVAGDTKVVDKGKGDGIYINTSGIGVIEHDLKILPESIAEGDGVIINGDVARHGMAIMAQREGLSFESTIESDSAALHDIVQKLIDNNVQIHCLRDLTRGGLSSALNEIAEQAGKTIQIVERNVPVRPDVRGACEVLGLDPLYVANEGRFIVIVPKKDVEAVLAIMKSHPLGKHSALIGEVGEPKQRPMVLLESAIGATRILDMLSGEQLPRIC